MPAAVTRFLLVSVVAFAVIAVGGYLALRQVALDQAVRETRDRAVAAGPHRRVGRTHGRRPARGPARRCSGSTTSCWDRCSTVRSCA